MENSISVSTQRTCHLTFLKYEGPKRNFVTRINFLNISFYNRCLIFQCRVIIFCIFFKDLAKS